MDSHPIVHLEISALDPAKSSKFYHDVFGWQIEYDPTFNYYQFRAEGGPGGGFNQIGGQHAPGEVIPYIGVNDVDAALEKVKAAGGEVVTPKMDIGDFGQFAIFSDPSGNRIGLYRALRQPG